MFDVGEYHDLKIYVGVTRMRDHTSRNLQTPGYLFAADSGDLSSFNSTGCPNKK